MAINRVAAQQMIKTIPTKLRAAARQERKVMHLEEKMDPVGASFKRAHGLFDFVNNEKLKALKNEIKQKLSLDKFVSPRQPITRTAVHDVEVVKASSILA